MGGFGFISWMSSLFLDFLILLYVVFKVHAAFPALLFCLA